MARRRAEPFRWQALVGTGGADKRQIAFMVGGFAAVGVTAIAAGLPYMDNYLPLGKVPGAVSSAGTIALISFLVGIGVAAAFVQIAGELLEQTMLVREGGG